VKLSLERLLAIGFVISAVVLLLIGALAEWNAWPYNALVAGMALGALAILAVAGRQIRAELARRRRAEDALRLNEQRLRLTIESINDYAVVMLDPTGRVIGWNQGAHRLKGYTSAEIVGQPFSRFYPAEMVREGVPERLLRTASEHGRVENSGWRVRKDGSQFWANVIISAVRDHTTSELLGFVKITRDLTEQLRAQKQIEMLNEDLSRRAALLEATNRELEAFSYSVSHDLRAPLRHIDGFAHLLSQRAAATLDAESRRFIEVISRSAKQMGALIDDLLAFSRIGRVPLRLETVNQRALIDRVIAERRYEAGGRPIRWEIGSLPDVRADGPLLRQVWSNLLDNAVKYSSKHPAPQIAIGGQLDDSTGEYVFFVRDNGVGFDMEFVDKLFGVFQRLHTPAEFEGTGIGLANVRRIVLRHGGRTWAEGKPDQGATFYFSIPATDLNGGASI
jgi:PAS domain S-box-containing protein